MALNKEEMLEAFANKERNKILVYLLKEPRRLTDISQNLSLNRSTVCLHLSALQRSKLVKFEYRVLEKPHSPSGTAAMFYSVDREQLSKSIEAMEKLISKLAPTSVG